MQQNIVAETWDALQEEGIIAGGYPLYPPDHNYDMLRTNAVHWTRGNLTGKRWHLGTSCTPS